MAYAYPPEGVCQVTDDAAECTYDAVLTDCSASGQTCSNGACFSTGCTTNADCDDGFTCTLDECQESNGVCTHTADPAVCSDGEYCNGAETCDTAAPQADQLTGCVAGTPVVCNDSDGIDCTSSQCDEVTAGCVEVPTDQLCSDGEFCNGAETCSPISGCVPGTPPCDDGFSCTNDCDEANSVCVTTPMNALCDDSQVCNGVETCEPIHPSADSAGCVTGTPVSCDDVCACSVDTCGEPGGTCLHDYNACDLPGSTPVAVTAPGTATIEMNLACSGQLSNLSCTTGPIRRTLYEQDFEGAESWSGVNNTVMCGSSGVALCTTGWVLEIPHLSTGFNWASRTAIDASGKTGLRLSLDYVPSPNNEHDDDLTIKSCCSDFPCGPIITQLDGLAVNWARYGPYDLLEDDCSNLRIDLGFYSTQNDELVHVDNVRITYLDAAMDLIVTNPGAGLYETTISSDVAQSVSVTCTWIRPDAVMATQVYTVTFN